MDTTANAFLETLVLYQSDFLASRNLAFRTRQEYTNDLTDLFRFLVEQCSLEQPQQVQRKHLESYLAELDRRGFKGSTRRRKVASIRSFFGFLADPDRALIPHSPAAKLIPPEREQNEPRVLSEA